jgi:hypothetical protein
VNTREKPPPRGSPGLKLRPEEADNPEEEGFMAKGFDIEGWVYLPDEQVVLDIRQTRGDRTRVIARVLDGCAGPLLAAGPDFRSALERIVRDAEGGKPANELAAIASNALQQHVIDALFGLEGAFHDDDPTLAI